MRSPRGRGARGDRDRGSLGRRGRRDSLPRSPIREKLTFDHYSPALARSRARLENGSDAQRYASSTQRETSDRRKYSSSRDDLSRETRYSRSRDYSRRDGRDSRSSNRSHQSPVRRHSNRDDSLSSGERHLSNSSSDIRRGSTYIGRKRSNSPKKHSSGRRKSPEIIRIPEKKSAAASSSHELTTIAFGNGINIIEKIRKPWDPRSPSPIIEPTIIQPWDIPQSPSSPQLGLFDRRPSIKTGDPQTPILGKRKGDLYDSERHEKSKKLLLNSGVGQMVDDTTGRGSSSTILTSPASPHVPNKKHGKVSVSSIQQSINEVATRTNNGVAEFEEGKSLVNGAIHIFNGYPHAVILSKISYKPNNRKFSIIQVPSVSNICIFPDKSVDIDFMLTPNECGYFQKRIELSFYMQDTQHKSNVFRSQEDIKFRVVRELSVAEATVKQDRGEDEVIFTPERTKTPEVIEPIEPYQNKKKLIRHMKNKRITNGPIDKYESPLRNIPFKYALREYSATDKSHWLKKSSTFTTAIPSDKHELVAKSHRLLFLEEEQMEIDMSCYSIDDLQLKYNRTTHLWYLTVSGVLEGRPSLFYGDEVIITLKSGKQFSGYIDSIAKTIVYLKFNTSLIKELSNDTLSVDLDFILNTVYLRRMHTAMDLLEFAHDFFIDAWVFPKMGPKLSNASIQNRDFIAKELISSMEMNERQIQGVAAITLNKDPNEFVSAPFIIFGPPGTGKTRVIVEAIKFEMKNRNANTRILILTPSNAAADLIVNRLSSAIQKTEMLRLNSPTRSPENVPDSILSYSLMSNGRFLIPTRNKMLKYKIICCTLFTSSILFSEGLFDEDGAGFSSIFVDECGQANESEFWAGLSGFALLSLDKNKTLADADAGISTQQLLHQVKKKVNKVVKSERSLPNLILAGDPKQLDAIVRSPVSQKYGFSTSLLDRLINSVPVYAKKGKDTYQHPENIVQLVDNYRSHPILLQLYNDSFYDGTLVPRAPKNERESLCRLEWLPKDGCPLVFHNVYGKDVQEGDSPSWVNNDEVDVVVKYIRTLFIGDSPPFPFKKKGTTHEASTSKAGMRILETQMNKIKGSVVERANINQFDIGIISPYRKQIEKIKNQLRKINLENIKVGSVEEFQGDERKVIIISSVRSNSLEMANDRTFNVGFLQSPKRFNVAVSRAKALLIVVGNAEILTTDPHWNRLVQKAVELKCNVGNQVPPQEKIEDLEDEEMEESVEEISAEDIGDVQAVDIGWRKDW